ncbi:HoxN/HupN/NixA family nickel/cobalt transporter [Methanothermococcus okinawensis]|uniref:High-affinity nickel-transporter n=1 Tax=Methanothermococcus okinawensis (strain DSM 14208 / JCM 11175 / IH1) TaxID=647113 RepID=F8ALH0_METOI|nr:sulfite exporter TauE/SafE family protein [Methanothermococcus okinawensis]AEH06859.1 high-affinity nickel-transporter [Methanothermococcus okinawensis IH1]
MELLWILTAFTLGFIHALEPGHGKSVMAAYVLGTEASLKDALLLGLTVVISHTSTVFLLGIFSIYLIESMSSEMTHDIMSVIGGGILITIGFWILKNNYFHPHEHKLNIKKGVLAIGLSAGLVPCPAALAVLLFSISSGNLYDGLIYVFIFSLGLSLSISLLSVLFVKGKQFIEKYIQSKNINKLPLISGIVIMLIGIYTISHPLLEHFI